MKRLMILGAFILLGSSAAGVALADPWKDESGSGRYERSYAQGYGYDQRYDQRYDRGDGRGDDRDYGYDDDRRDDRGWRAGGVPRGHLPPPGLCRVWYPDRPPGQQPPPTSCQRAERIAERTGARVISSRGVRTPYAGVYGRDTSGYGDERVCVAFDPYGNCLETRRPRR